MFLPFVIAMLLGLASPMQQTAGNINTSIQTTNGTDPTEGGGVDNGGGTGGGHNGDNGQIPPPRP
ncbi:hypothetical protein ACTHQF_07630 [Pedobacter sp. SAFR-022]|uniref:hypothetical protein n=1 Tax=Pedobacter sp. SAFR-022 TaxID=3436861 RepID=UPI003F806603